MRSPYVSWQLSYTICVFLYDGDDNDIPAIKRKLNKAKIEFRETMKTVCCHSFEIIAKVETAGKIYNIITKTVKK